ncbi:MAG: tRNA threonylcarbamoyladenosine dehydratase [Oscillospiraceae bacterium]|nr:tRNA threonylcarbamoyladenosine dehydratase [Oscillospiraceae bacterium]
MSGRFTRTEMLYGPAAMERLSRARVTVFGLGGVGGYAVEALARSGVGALDLIDSDTVSLTNLNRQILATEANLGRLKTEAAKERILSINPECRIRCFPLFYLPETSDRYDFDGCQYVIDAVDTVTAKLLIAAMAQKMGIPMISVMGTGNRTDPTKLRIGDLRETRGCPLARIMRKECLRRGIERLQVVWSTELPVRPLDGGQERDSLTDEWADAPDRVRLPGRRSVPGSTAFVPAVAGMMAASEAVRVLSGRISDEKNRPAPEK